jgi:hypothetical protein
VISLLWLAPWLRWMPRGPGIARAHVLGLGPDALAILKRRAFWGNSGGSFCFAYMLYAVVVWLPFYLMRERRYSMVAMARIGGAIYAMQALFALLSGRYADRRVAASGCGNMHRTFMVLGTCVGGTMLFLSTLLPAIAKSLCATRLRSLPGSVYGEHVVRSANSCGTAGSRPVDRTCEHDLHRCGCTGFRRDRLSP